MYYTYKMHCIHFAMWLFLLVLHTIGYIATEQGLPNSDESKKNSILRLYDARDPNTTQANTAQLNAVDICNDAIDTAMKRCKSPMTLLATGNATFVELSEVLFDSGILSELRSSCTNGTWCLPSGQEIRLVVELGNKFLSYCPIGPCLLQMDDACLTPERRLTLASLLLLCRAHELEMSPNCKLSLRKMTHVTMTPLHHKLTGEGSTVPTSQMNCSSQEQKNCTGSCPQVAKQLFCTCATCDHQMHFLKEFGPWQWFYNNNMGFCGISNSTDCSRFNDPVALEFQLEEGGLMRYLNKLDLGVLIGASVAGGATIILLLCLIVFCAQRLRHRSKFNRHYIHYHEITAPRETDDLTKGAFNDCNVVDLNKVYESID